MERPERFSLEWSEFETNLHNTFAELRREEHFSDVTLVSKDGNLVKAHKLLLSANSPLLDKILKSQDHPKPLIFMHGAKTDVLISLLDFIYSGKVEIRGNQLDEFMALANDLKVKGLSKDQIEASGEKDSKVAIANKKMKKTYRLGLSEDNEIEEDKSEKDIKDDLIDLSDNFVLEDEKMNLLDCNLCEKTSSSVQGLERHKQRYHSTRKEKAVAANGMEDKADDLIDLIDNTAQGLEKHKSARTEKILEEKDTKDKDIKDDLIDLSESLVLEDDRMNLLDCNLCVKTSKTVQGLEMHKYRYHSAGGERLEAANMKIPAEHKGSAFSCNLCDATSISKAGLHKHKIRNHSG